MKKEQANRSQGDDVPGEAKTKGDQDLECPENLGTPKPTSSDEPRNDQFLDSPAEGDNSSQYEDIENEGQYLDDDEKQEDYDSNSATNQKLLKQKLKLSDKLSPQFHRFYENFSSYVNFIIQYEYNILPQQRCYQTYQQHCPTLHMSQDQTYQYLSDQKQRDAA